VKVLLDSVVLSLHLIVFLFVCLWKLCPYVVAAINVIHIANGLVIMLVINGYVIGNV